MTARLLLISSNLTPAPLAHAAGNLIRGFAAGAIITTAEAKLKERNRNALLAHETFAAAGVPRLAFFDLDTRPAAELASFDFVYLAGGNPFYLLRRLRETGADSVLDDFISAGRPIVGSSAGAIVLGPSLRLVRVFDSTVPDLGWKDDDGLGVIPFAVLPHANRWRDRLRDYPRRVDLARTQSGCPVEEIDDDEGLAMEGVLTTRLRPTFASRPPTR